LTTIDPITRLFCCSAAIQSALPAPRSCAHYAGAVPARPALSFKIFNGSLFEQIDLAVGFVMDRLGTSLGARTEGAGAPIAHEIPRDAVNETIVNAIAHRDYTSAAGVHVNVFSDRVEIANPGELPRG
jgi:predicted HTH transcriptional regulator